jgi:histidine triad (HIT) family protein
VSDCLFCKIVAGEIPSDTVYEDDHVLAFRDINPQAPTHVLVIPKKHISTIHEATDADAELLGRIQLAANRVADVDNLPEAGFRTVYNCGKAAGQEVYHIHLHVLGGRGLSWPPG